MSIKKIKKHNSSKFLDDLKSVHQVMVFTRETGKFLSITKRELLECAEYSQIHYRITDKVFIVKRDVMIIE